MQILKYEKNYSIFFSAKWRFFYFIDIVINEIGAYEASGHEWVEIWNKGSEQVNLTGWKFWENSTNHGLSISTTDAIMAPGEYAVITQDDKQFILDYPSFSGSIFDSSWSSLNESGEEIGLKDASGNFVEKFTYVSAPSFSLQRRDVNFNDYTGANWAEHASGNTIGAANVFASQTQIQTITQQTDQSAQQTRNSVSSPQIIVESPPQNLIPIKLNEFMAYPVSGNEWVELYNTSDSLLDMTGAMICDSRNTTSTCKKIVGAIRPKSWFVFDLNTRSFLNNGGDSVIFKDLQGVTIDRVDYDDELIPDKDQSVARAADGADTDSENDWEAADKVTMGSANITIQQNQPNITSSTTPNFSGLIGFVSTTTKKNSSAAKIKNTGAKTYGFVNSIEVVRQASNGTWARVKGVVTVLPGVFGSQYFYLTDGNAGIQIYQNKKDFPILAAGDLVEAQGTVSEASGIKRINIKSKKNLDILATNQFITGTELDLAEIDENLAGGLVKLRGEITEIKSNFMYVDDGSAEIMVYLKKGVQIDKDKFQEGENVEVTGVLEHAKNGWQVWPRAQNDLASLGLSEDLLKKQNLQNSGAGNSERYFTATAGGFATLIFGFLFRSRGAFLRRGAMAFIGFIKKNKS
jgi:DNA/RNA endonuclease YhcR with UshA esterase domain